MELFCCSAQLALESKEPTRSVTLLGKVVSKRICTGSADGYYRRREQYWQ